MLQNKAFVSASALAPVVHSNETGQLSKPRKIRRFRQRPDQLKYLSDQQIAAFFTALEKADLASKIRDRALFRVIYHRGLRACEPGLLMFADFDQKEGTLRVTRRKGSLSGTYGLVDVEARALRGWIKKRGSAAGPLFGTRNHRPVSRRMVHHLFRYYAERAGIPSELAHPHALKHSCGTHLLSLVNDLHLVKDHLGHVSVQSTEIYAQVQGKKRDEVRDRIKGWK